MKARVKARGEIVDVYCDFKEMKYDFLDETGKGYMSNDLTIFDNEDYEQGWNDGYYEATSTNHNPDYWTRLEHQYAGMAMQGAWICPDGYIFKDENGNVINATKIVLEKKKKEYPKTYEECLKVLSIEGGRLMFNNSGITQYERELYIKVFNLSKLLICRDAYWKIAGEEMGLGKPWEPDWLDDDTKKYVITSTKVFETFGGLGYINYILTFPTEEMRDAFYENFKEEIEQCKELL